MDVELAARYEPVERPAENHMPLYEYECSETGEVVTLLRPMADADLPVEDPSGLQRAFVRRHSVFGVSSGTPESSPAPGSCACGMRPGTCGGA